MEAKYIYNFRYLNRFSERDLKELARSFRVTYTHPYLNRRQIVKKLAIFFYEKGVNYKDEVSDFKIEKEKEVSFNPDFMEVKEDEV